MTYQPSEGEKARPLTVVIVQRRLTAYRVPLFEAMRTILGRHDIQLRVLHGDGTAAEAKKSDAGSLAWAERLETTYLLDGRLCWQPFAAQSAGSDLVIVTQENKLLNNLWALASPWRRGRLAFWGHGRNMQSSNPGGLLEAFKRWTTNRVDWWFAYTELSAAFVREAGFAAERITVLNNAIDTTTLHDAVAAARQLGTAALRDRFGLTSGPVGIFIGSLYADKRLRFLIDAVAEVRRREPGFQLVIAGEGADRSLVTEAAAADPAIHYLGSVGGSRKAELLACADMMLNPGLVGLGILDAFVAGLPLLTTDCGLHSPEISYLQSGTNGLMTADRIDAYADAVVTLWRDPAQRALLSTGAARSARDFSVERMAERFCDGIRACLADARRPAA